MGKFYIDDQEVNFEPGQNVLQAALKAGINAPYFCYHEALGSAGACRMCTMELEPTKEGENSRLVVTCLQAAQDGQRYRLNKGIGDHVRQGVVEYYMTRHPHDCPVCDEAGDCQLQDMTILSHHTYRRFKGAKRTYMDQPMGPLIYNTANRCITCYRCTRFYQDYALGDDFGVYASGNRTTFRRSEEGHFDSPFSGNLIDVCPTGTFTDKVFRRKFSRTWQLEKNESICGHCSVGCHTEPGGRDNSLRRVHPFPNTKVNAHFICDRGRFGEHFSEANDRPLSAQINGVVVDNQKALDHIKDILTKSAGRIGILSSPDEDVSCHYALANIAEHFNGLFSPFVMPQTEDRTAAALALSRNTPSLTDIETADGAIIVGALTETAPMMDLAVRQLIKAGKTVHMLHASPTLLADIVRKQHPDQIHQAAPKNWAQIISSFDASHEAEEMGPNLFANLDTGKRIIILGVAVEMDIASMHALHDLCQAFENKQLTVQLGFALNGANATGSAMISAQYPSKQLLDAVRKKEIDTLMVCGADPFGFGAADWLPAREHIKQLIVFDNVNSPTLQIADVILPHATWSERRGISINYEGRIQGFNHAYQRAGTLTAVNLATALIGISANNFYEQQHNNIETLTGLNELHYNGCQCLNLHTQFEGRAEANQVSIDTNKDSVQVVRLTWHGGSNKASYATALASIKPWKDNIIYLHPDTAKRLQLNAETKLKLGNPTNANDNPINRSGMDQAFPIILNDNVAVDCLALTRTTLHHVGHLVNAIIPIDKLSIIAKEG
ncbi:molybdopterin-dependent oxidoreductase [Shewanella surugensis]|uniref:NADH-quinone oxidoreductase subunit G n=1 Tax=Shewanella surugensis TaxID=212020 RepID=A0ABT0L8S5_9GAMM|nr:molybdopterin-dependent oxidoreductase [Shewanella surugensis]MCL1124091.1 2Fe-2S iron-sulfur cluster-binding protein [Shewanella surugensis]